MPDEPNATPSSSRGASPGFGGASSALLSIFFVAIALCAVGSVLVGALGRLNFVADLASHFRIQATIAVSVSAIALAIFRRKRAATWCFIATVILGITLVPFLPRGSGNHDATHYRLMTMNVLTQNTEKQSVIEFVRQTDPDFLLLQETNALWIDQLNEALLKDWPYTKAIPREDNFGMVVYSKLPLESIRVNAYAGERSSPSISVQIALPAGESLRLISTHPPPPMRRRAWERRNEHFENLATDVKDGPADRTLVCGDLNCTPWSPCFKDLLKRSGLSNSAIGRGIGITWAPFRTRLLGLPIDHVLVGSEIKVLNRHIGPPLGSDHRAVIVDFR